MPKPKGEGKKPDLIAWHAPSREGAPWTRIGAAWMHKDGNGMSLQLELMPINENRIMLRVPKAKDEGEDEQPDMTGASLSE